MARSRRLLTLLVPVAVSLFAQAFPGRAEQAPSARFAFADTTLLRDTLGLSFKALFPMADSLQLTPDTLRAWMIRYRMTIPRLLSLADSLHMVVDSVGPVMLREQFNPLSTVRQGQKVTDFNYTSGYSLQRTTSDWTNTSSYNLRRGPVYLTNSVNIDLQRINSAGAVSLRQNREATTESGVALGKSLSLGGRSYQLRFFSADPGSPTTQDETKSEYDLTGRGQAKSKHVSSDLSARAGFLDDHTAAAVKRGLSSGADGRVRVTFGSMLSHDLSGSLSGNASKVPVPGRDVQLSTHDFSSSVRGNLAIAPNAPVGLNFNYGFRNTRVQNMVLAQYRDTLADNSVVLDTLPYVNTIITKNKSADGTMRIKVNGDRYVNLNGSISSTGSPTGTSFADGGKSTLRWLWFGIGVDANYNDTRTRSDFFRQRGGGGYTENETSREGDAQITRSFGPKFVGKMLLNISLDRVRYVAFADSATPPTPRDNYRQDYRTELLYNRSERMNSAVAVEVSLTSAINLPAATTGSNTDTWSYRAEWRWSYHVLRSLTVTQNNLLTADYGSYPFVPTRNTLGLNYNSITTLSAVLPGNFAIDLQHNTSQQPRGSYLTQPDGTSALQLSDESKAYTLYSSIRYTPAPALAIHLEPRYSANDRSGTVNGVPTKQRTDLRLDFSGGVDLNWKVGAKGTLTGRLSRVYSDAKTISYQDGLAIPSPRSETDYWMGNLQFSWTL